MSVISQYSWKKKKKKWSRSDLKKKKAREVLFSLFYGNLCNPG